MSHYYSKIEILNLLLKLLFNHYLHQYSYSYCRCRCHQRRTIQINTIHKQRNTFRQVSRSRHLTKTLEKIVKKRTLESEINKQLEN